jgi:pimeloyl-ACP methyl ester carboxylesterase
MDSLMRDGIALAFVDAGKGAPPLLLIHDLGGDHTAMRAQLARFRGRHRVVAVDLRGHGRSDAGGEAPSLAAFAEDLIWLCYELGVYRPIAVGRGAGGAIAAEIAARRPDLLAGLVTVDTHAADEQVNEEVDALIAARSK